MREKEDMRDKKVRTKKKEEPKKSIWEKEKISACYGCGIHVYRFIENI